MLLVKTYIGKSEISGIGLFAAEPIRKGQAIWKWSNGDSAHSYESIKNLLKHPNELAVKEANSILHFAYTDNGLYKMCGDDGKYMNHSPDPNTESCNTEFDEIEIANRDIEIGEELTCDYFKINDDHSREIFIHLKNNTK